MNTDRSHSIHRIAEAMTPRKLSILRRRVIFYPSSRQYHTPAVDDTGCPVCHAAIGEDGRCASPDWMCSYRREQ